MTINLGLWIYAALLVAGGLMGFLKAGSKASLIASVACAIPLALVAAGRAPLVVAMVVAGVLAGMMGSRWVKTKSLMPAGMVTILSVAMLLWMAIPLIK